MAHDRVLLIDDDPHVLGLLRDVLERERYEVFTAEDGEGGWAALIGERPDLVITDVMMPKLDGFELVRRVRADPLVGRTPLMILSAKAEEEDRIRGLELGADDYLVKPFTIDLLLARVRALLSRRPEAALMTLPSPGAPFASRGLEHLTALTFDTFLVGEGNARAAEAARAVAESLGHRHNPLFLWGGPGRGKTHLLCAIANEVASKDPTKTILYLSSETFSQQILDAYERRAVEQLRADYARCDLFLIDDIQFLAASGSLQAVAVGIFSEMCRDHRQIVITGDRRPEELPGLTAEMSARLTQGLVVPVGAPDPALRASVLRAKALRVGWPVPLDLLDYLALNLDCDLRTLEGAAKKLVAMRTLGGVPLDRPVVDGVIATVRETEGAPNEGTPVAPPGPRTAADEFLEGFGPRGHLAYAWGTPGEMAALVPEAPPVVVLGPSAAHVVDTMAAIAGMRGGDAALPEGPRWACILHPEEAPGWLLVGTNHWGAGDDLSWALAGRHPMVFLLVFDSAVPRVAEARRLVASVPQGAASAVVVLFAGADRIAQEARSMLASGMRRLFRVPPEIPVIVAGVITPPAAQAWLRSAWEGEALPPPS